MGGHAAAFTSPPAFINRLGGMPIQHVHAEGTGDFAPASLRCVSSNVDDHPAEPDVGGHAQLASATASIFKRSALLCNLLSAQALAQSGATGSSFGRTSAIRPRATAHDFDHLSALALASEGHV